MQVGALMKRCGHQAQRTTPISTIARMMGDQGARTIAIAEDGELVGLVTDWDISCRLVIAGHEIASATAADVMEAAQLRCAVETDIAQALAMMEQAGTRCLAVTDRNQRLLGTLHRDEVPRAA